MSASLQRVRQLLSRPGLWLDRAPLGYVVRGGPDRRRRPMAAVDEAEFAALCEQPGLSPRAGGGWIATTDDGAGRPGLIEGLRTVTEPDGRPVTRRANLGESPLAWLARRKDPQGRPWLTPVETAAGERLREDFEASGGLGRTTMRWDPVPRTGRGAAPALAPAERAVLARARVEAALAAAGPGLREMLEHVCLGASALDAAERSLGLPRRAGKTVLKLGLQRLAAHYRVG